MLSIDFIRENKKKVAEAAINKNRNVDLDRLLLLDDRRRELITKAQEVRKKRNKLSSNSSKPTSGVIEEGRRIKEQLKKIEGELKHVDKELVDLMLHVPNVPLDEVPVGKKEEDNAEVRKWGDGDISTFNFQPKSHIELGEALDVLDFDRGSKVSGFRGYFVKNELAQLQFAVLFYAFQKISAKGYIPIIAPSIVKEFTLFGSGHFPWGRAEDVYALGKEDDAYLSGTAEIPVTAYYSGEVLREKDLPKKFVALSPCFRREAGSYGRDTRGIVRVHEFLKIEQVIIAPNDLEDARSLHNELQQTVEEIVQDLQLPYRVMLMATGDMGEPQIFKQDIEVWMPSQKTYREYGSNSILGDFQARRLNIRYKTKEDEMLYCYTLNNTVVASARTLAFLMENHQQKDGSILIPKALQHFTGFDKIKRT